jgi:Carboxypeptidase regulatory-like domain
MRTEAPLRHARLALGLTLLFVAAGTYAHADVTGRIAGTVKDASGAVVAGAKVTAKNMQTGLAQTVATADQGAFGLLGLPPGNYEIEVRSTGFKDYHQTNLTIDVNTSLRVDITLQVGQVLEQVTVSAGAVHVETESTQAGEVIGSTKMTTIPLNGRSYTDLFALQPGVVPISSGQYSPISPSGNLNAGSLSVGGQRETANGFMVNGGNVEEGTFNGSAIIPNLDSIAEFRIITNNFDAEYGNYAGGQINAVTKSGTNQLHGDVFEFLRNTDFDARNFFSPTLGAFHQNQFGGTVGGPLRRNKVFLFADYQGTRLVVGRDTGLIPVPSLQDRAGDLSNQADSLLPNSQNQTGTVGGSYWAGVLSQELGYSVAAGEPYYTSGCGSVSQCVFPNALIPQSAISAPAQALLKYIPVPNNGQNFSTSAFNQTLRDDKGGLRLDAETGWGRLSAYYFLDDYRLDDPYPSGGATLPGFAALTAGRSQLLNLSDTLPLSGGTAFNEFRFSYLRATTLFTKPQGGTGPSLSSLGFVEGANTLGIVPLAHNSEGVPAVYFNAFTIGVPAYFDTQFNNTFQWTDNYSRVTGKHTMMLGGNFHYDQITTHDFGANNGSFGFAGGETGNDFADFLLGAPSYYQQGYQLPLHSRGRYLGLFAQDSWRARPGLTVNYGLRWEVTMPWYEQNNQLETIVPGLQSVVFPGAPLGWVVPGDPGIPSTVAPTRYKNFGPRIGLAYSPDAQSGLWRRLVGPTGKTSIRAAYGIFYTAIEQLTNALVVGDPPFGLFYSSPVPSLFATPFVDRATGQSEGQRFPPPLPPVGTGPKNPDPNIDWSVYEPISSAPGYLHTNKVPSTQQFQLSIERELGKDTLLNVSYVGALGRHLLVDLEANPGNPALCLSLPGCGPYGEDGSYTNALGQTVNGTRPLSPGLGSNGWYANIGNSSYNALEVTLRHVSGPLEFLAGYTYSKSLDWSSALGEQVNPFQPSLSRALSAFDMTHNFVLSYSYELPFAKLFGANRVSTGWLLSGITRFTTGLPVTLLENDDNSLLGTNFTGPNEDGIDLPVFTPGNLNITDPRKCPDIASPRCQSYFNTSLFSPEPLGQLGNARRRFFHGPGINNWDMALLKNLRLTETKNLQFRFEFFNVFNHAQFNSPDGNILDSTSFGKVTSAADPRIGQVALKFIF